VREPRQNNRNHLDIDDNNLPFYGADLWNAYEVSCLNKNGIPMTGVAKILYPANSKYIVESKSLKLYLNSFNMSQYGVRATDTRQILQSTITEDLSKLLETSVSVYVLVADNPFKAYVDMAGSNTPDDIFTTSRKMPNHAKFQTLESAIDTTGIVATKYVETPSLLKVNAGEPGSEQELYLHSSLLKSNCKVTHQPDWGDVFIYMVGQSSPTLSSLLEYIISFRGENHFHEEICETIFVRLKDVYNPIRLGVACLYVRRGGIDINPIRVSDKDLIGSIFQKNILQDSGRHLKLLRQ
jgi:7-cyano-7-deazaguanine reductase